MDVLAALIPSVVVLGFFIALLVTALRATDKVPGRGRQSTRLRDRPASGESGASPRPEDDGSES